MNLAKRLHRTTLAVLAAWVFLSQLQGQPLVRVDESKIRAVLRNERTTIAIPFANSLDRPITAQLTLSWVDTKDRESSPVQRELAVEKGLSTIETPLRVADPSLWTRLRYRITPSSSDARAFAPVAGLLSLSHIADHVFELKASVADWAHRGRSLTVHVEAVHPVSRLPLAVSSWKAVLTLDGQALSPRLVTKRSAGFVDFAFDLPLATAADPDEDAEVEIAATLGDFTQNVSLSFRVPNRMSARLQSDKPIYQPGQVLHLRAVVLDAQGRAASGARVSLRVEDHDHERVHTAQLVASKFGIVSDDWTLPASAGLGTYRITLAAVDDDDYQIGQHSIRVSRYELPSFTVTAKPDHAVYLPSEPARVTVTGSYLFGKPVPRGRVKIVRTREPRWNARTRKSEPADETVAEGEAKEDGTFTAAIDLRAEHQDLAKAEGVRFEDIHFAAYFTDSVSRRTEQRRFDLRITRHPLHIYVVRSNGGGFVSQPVYILTSYADGRPASADVEIELLGRKTRLRTNRYGVGKAEVPGGDRDIEDGVIVKATDAAGRTGIWHERYWSAGVSILRIDTPRTLHRAGEAVTLRIASPPQSPAGQAVMIHAIVGGRTIATRIAELTGHHGEVTFPYQPEFRRAVVFVAWNAIDPNADYRQKVLGSRAVIFPDSSDLTLSASTGRNTYQPGEQATVQMRVTGKDGQPVAAAVALAVVDQAVLERARTDRDFGPRSWFACAFCGDEGEAEIGGVRLNDLYSLRQTAQITPELDLAAEALVARASAYVISESSEAITDVPAFPSVTAQIQRLTASLESHYTKSLEFPDDLQNLMRILGREWSDLADPWGRPYRAQFSIDGLNRVLAVLSSGPDQRLGTADDFIAGAVRRPYFTPIQHLIQQTLRKQTDYPATADEFAALLREEGLLLASLRDPWGTPYRVQVTTNGAFRQITFTSAGPDQKPENSDDFVVADFSGAYFRRESAAIAQALAKVPHPPNSLDEFRAALEQASLDVTRYRDAWGRPYHVTSVTSFRYADRTSSTTTRVFGEAAVVRTDVTPITQALITFALRSHGPDGVENTYDDFDIARFPVLLRSESAVTPRSPSAAPLRGTGAVFGTVTDPAGASIPNASLVLLDAAMNSYESTTDQGGVFHFTSLAPGRYVLRVAVPGFMSYELSQVPVTAGQTTTADVELRVGSVADSVNVEARAETLQTTTAAVASSVVAATPRVREYFPETLVWLPELLTGLDGRVVSRFTLADSVTTWKVAAFASTLDGRMAETEVDLRAFQPFFLEFNPPPVLTEGDRLELPATIRNYQPQAQSVNAALQANDWSTIVGDSSKRVTVPANGSLTVNYGIEARRPLERAGLRITAQGGRVQDAVQSSTSVHPDGQQVVQTFADFVAGQASFSVPIPANALAQATRAELRIYPNLASLLLESSAAILTVPHGCAEQTISAGYANLVALRFTRAAGLADPQIEKRALANIRLAIDGLGAFRNSDGGVRYWSTEEPDLAVTSHALSFLVDVADVAHVDKEDLQQLVSWLEQAQGKDGRWVSGRTAAQSPLLTATVARALAQAQHRGIAVQRSALGAAYRQLAQVTDQMSEPYLLANFILAGLASGDEALLGNAAAKLIAMARTERDGVYWDLQTNSPYYGWGTAGRYETTGLAVSALAAWRAQHSGATDLDSHLRRGLVFLLRGRDATGGWQSTQATLRAMRAISDASSLAGSLADAGGTFELRSRGRLLKSISLPRDPQATDPVIVDVSAFLSTGENQLSLTSAGPTGSALARLTSTHWLPWAQTKPRSSPDFRFSVSFDRLEVAAGEPVRCNVQAERVGFRGYGMMLAEIGLPPGAEVDRSSLESVIEDGALGVDHYEVLPDRIVFYLWPKAGGANFSFFLTPRYAMTAKSAPSLLYDYYNPEALSEVAPLRWTVSGQ